MRGLLLTSIAAMMLGTGDRSDAEACRFAGTTDPSGKVAVTADVTETNGTTRGRPNTHATSRHFGQRRVKRSFGR
jgi:hypothetical protein